MENKMLPVFPFSVDLLKEGPGRQESKQEVMKSCTPCNE